MKKRFIAVLLMAALAMTACTDDKGKASIDYPTYDGSNEAIGDSDDSFGEKLEDTGVYDGYFDTATEDSDICVSCVSGTADAFTLEGNTLTFSGISEDSVYSVSGKLSGNIVIDVGDAYKFELELTGFSLVSTEINPVTVLSGDKVTLTAKKDTSNYIYDKRAAVDESDETLTKGAVRSEVDLKIGGKGSLSVVSENNNGIHTKDDLEVKNLTLTVACRDNALKGNDSVTLTDGNVTLISTVGDGIKTVNSDISDKGNQRGSVTVTGTVLTVYAACDGIDAAYDAVIEGEGTLINIYTDKYSNYSEEVTATSSNEYYIRFTSNAYKYSVKYYNSDSDYVWENATYHSAVSGTRTTYYYYSFPKRTGYSKIQFFIYSSDMQQGQEDEKLVSSDYLELNTSYDTFALTNSYSGLYYEWTNYTTSVQEGGFGGFGGGMNDGNSDKGDHSTKGIKAGNEIVVNNGTLNIKSYDDAIHANNTGTLENGNSPLGDVTVNGGTLSLYSNDDGLHADGTVYVNGGAVNVLNSYEGVEGSRITVSGGEISVIAKDDGFNATATSGTGITLSGGFVYVYCSGDGFDTNAKDTTYQGISFEGGNAVIIANSSGNSAIDTEKGYKYTSGSIVAIMPRGGMTSEATHCSDFSSVGTTVNMSLSSGSTVTVSGDMELSFSMPCSISNAYVVILNKNISVSN